MQTGKDNIFPKFTQLAPAATSLVILMRLMGVAALEAFSLPPSRIRNHFLTLAFLVLPLWHSLAATPIERRADARSTNEIEGPDTRTQTQP